MEIEHESIPENAKDLVLGAKNGHARHDTIHNWLDYHCSRCDTDSEMLAMLNDKLDDIQTIGSGMSYNTRKSYHDSMVLKYSLQKALSMKKKNKKQKPVLSGNMGADYGDYELKTDPKTDEQIENINKEWANIN